MKSRIVMSLTIILFCVCLVWKAEAFSGELSEEVIEANTSYEDITPVIGLSEDQKREALNNYLENTFAKEIMEVRGILGCKVKLDIYNEEDDEKTITVQYFYDPAIIDDAAVFEDTIRQYMLTNVPEAEVVYLRGTPVTYENAVEFTEDYSPIENLPIDLDSNLNYIPVVPY